MASRSASGEFKRATPEERKGLQKKLAEQHSYQLVEDAHGSITGDTVTDDDAGDDQRPRK
jgi:hypothetical protein